MKFPRITRRHTGGGREICGRGGGGGRSGCGCGSSRACSSSNRDSNAAVGNGVPTSLRFSLLLHLQLLAENGRDLTLHERPRYRRVGQRTLFPTRTVNFRAGALSLDALPTAGEAELVMTNRWTLHEMRIFQPLLAQGTLKRWIGRRCRCRTARGSRRCIARSRTGWWRKSTGTAATGTTAGTGTTGGATARRTATSRWRRASVRAAGTRIRTGIGTEPGRYTAVRWAALRRTLRLWRWWRTLLR